MSDNAKHLKKTSSVKHVAAAASLTKAHPVAGPADPTRPWQSYRGHDPVLPHRQAAAEKLAGFEAETATLENVHVTLTSQEW